MERIDKMKQFLEAGEFVTTHGVMGELKLYPWSDSPDFVAGLPRLYLSAQGGKALKPVQVRIHKGMCIVKLEGVDSIEAARPYLRRTVYFDRNDVTLPEGRYFVQDIIGCRVVDADTGHEYGEIVHITHPGANDVYTIRAQSGQEYLFPAVDEFLAVLEPENRLVFVRPIPGMFGEMVNGDADED